MGVPARVLEKLPEVDCKIGEHTFGVVYGMADFLGLRPHGPGLCHPPAGVVPDPCGFENAHSNFFTDLVYGRPAGVPGELSAGADETAIGDQDRRRGINIRRPYAQPVPDVIAFHHNDDQIQVTILGEYLLKGCVEVGGGGSGPADVSHVCPRCPENDEVFGFI
jgi:hypothetical protein